MNLNKTTNSNQYNCLLRYIYPTIIFLLIVATGCGVFIKPENKYTFDIDTYKLHHSILIEEYPEYYNLPYTFEIILDRKACGSNLRESVFWAEWQKYIFDLKYNFVFITSRVDSSGLAHAIALENISAPVLVLPDCNERVSDLWYHQSMVLKILYNTRNGEYNWIRGSIIDQKANDNFMRLVDSVINAPEKE